MGGKKPIREKKSDKSAGSWMIRKIALGRQLDGGARTISFPPDKSVAYIAYTEAMLSKYVAQLNTYRKSTD
jgi:hypothetical protein